MSIIDGFLTNLKTKGNKINIPAQMFIPFEQMIPTSKYTDPTTTLNSFDPDFFGPEGK